MGPGLMLDYTSVVCAHSSFALYYQINLKPVAQVLALLVPADIPQL